MIWIDDISLAIAFENAIHLYNIDERQSLTFRNRTKPCNTLNGNHQYSIEDNRRIERSDDDHDRAIEDLTDLKIDRNISDRLVE